MIDRRGHVLSRLTVDGKASFEKIRDLDGDKRQEVLISTWSGGAHASFAYYILSLHPKPRCILAFWKGNGEGLMHAEWGTEGDLEPIDLDGDGRPELVS
jgi:hypothetical protein